MTAAAFQWEKELEKTVLHSLVTSFGLDFLLVEDRKGGNVDTVHNARQGVYASREEQERYDGRGAYDKGAYHKHPDYKARNAADQVLQDAGKLVDALRGQALAPGAKRDLDHMISGKENHDDAGRVLAELDGPALANRDANPNSTGDSVNRSKKAKSAQEFLMYLKQAVPAMEDDLRARQRRLEQMPRETPQEQDQCRRLEAEIRKKQAKIEQLKAVDPQAVAAADQKARRDYEQQVNTAYYTGSKFLMQSGVAAGDMAARMGVRQVLGLVLAELWHEMKDQVPVIFRKHRNGFELSAFLRDVGALARGVWLRVKSQFKTFLTAFKEGAIGGALASATTTLFNIFATSQKMVVRLIREMWSHLVKAVKLIAFNPEKLGRSELVKAVTRILGTGLAAVAGAALYGQLAPLLTFPFGSELAAFVGAMATGLLTLGFQYFLDHSALMRRVWAFLDASPHADTVEQFRAMNERLDAYLAELARIEFNLDATELQEFARTLAACNDEGEKALLLQAHVEARGIQLPFEVGNAASTRDWLAGLARK